MSELNLAKSEITLLTEAAAQGGKLVPPERLKPATRDRMLARLLREALIAAGPDGGGHVLTRAGYRAVGLDAPRVARSGTKHAVVIELLEREQGASLQELIGQTGWLPHTARAVLSRLRSSGKPLAKTTRPDGATAYKIDAAPATAA